jgi:hypothetical protein
MEPAAAASLIDETTAWLDEAASAGRAADCRDGLLDLVRRGIRLRRQWDVSDADSPLRRELLGQLVVLQNGGHEQLAACVAEHDDAPAGLVQRLAWEIEEDDAYLAELLDGHRVPPDRAALAVDCFRDDLHWLGTLAAATEGRRGVDFFGRVLLEHEALEQEIEAWSDSDEVEHNRRSDEAAQPVISDELRSAVGELKQSIQRRQVAALLARAPEETCEGWRREWETAGRLAMRLPSDERRAQPARDQRPAEDNPQGPVEQAAETHADAQDDARPVAEAAPEAEPLGTSLAGYRARALERWRACLESCEADARRQSLRQAAESLNDQVNETLTFLEDLPLEASVQSLKVLEEESRHCREVIESSGDPELADAARVLRRRQRDLAAELMERRLAARMERWFGRRGVAALERLILVLLLLFVVLLAVEGPLVAYEERWWPGRGWAEAALAWADLGICLVFLSEFVLKFSLARPRWLFFRRNWFTMLLPSIPFGFMAYQAHRLLLVVELGESVVLVRFLRYLRLPRMVRWLRIARPLVRAGRLVGFALQASDRLVRQLAPLLNRNLVLFERADVDVQVPAHRRALAGLRERFRYRAPALMAEVPRDGREHLVRARIDDLRSAIAAAGENVLVVAEPVRRQSGRDIPLEELIGRLMTATPASVSDRIGRALAQSVARWCRAFDVLLVRRIPLVADLVAAGKLQSPYETTAAVANRLGMLLRHALDRMYWMADLYGTVTAPQLVDSLGEWMVKGTARPARRLLMIGAAFLAVSYLASLLPFSTLKMLTEKLERLVGTPLVALGVACLVPLLLGLWFRQIAGEATDFYSRVAEAQFFSATKRLKQQLARSYHAVLYRRVIAPELAWEESTAGPVPEGDSAPPEGDPPPADRPPSADSTHHAEANADSPPAGSPADAARATVERLWEDFLDGAPFHRSDTKTTTQLLGNLVLVSLRNSRLRLDRARRKQLRRLDLTFGRFSLRGPYLWFHFISRSLAQHTAKLTVDYNHHALTLARLETADDAAVRRYIGWLSRRLGVPADDLDLPEQLQRRIAHMVDSPAADHSGAVDFHGNDFTAIHFLSRDPQLSEEIRLRYGDTVARLVERDRRDNIRRVFRTYPLHYLPRTQRVVNLLSIYHRHFEGGKVLVLPLKLLWWKFVLLWRGLRLVAGFVAEVLHPTAAELGELTESDPFVVAERKIHRMRKPLFLECLRMRADFDPEYLGVMLPGSGVAKRGTTNTPVETDLTQIGADPNLFDAYRKLAAERRWQILRFRRWLQTQPDRPPVGSALRAMAIAYTLDHHGARGGLEATAQLADAVAQVDWSADKPADRVGWSWRGFGARCWRGGRMLLRWRRLFKQKAFQGYSRRQRRYLRRRVVRGGGALYRAALALTAWKAPDDPLDHGETVLKNVARDPESWTNQLVVLRAVQTLSVLDLKMYCELVAELGEYDDAPRSNACNIPAQ